MRSVSCCLLATLLSSIVLTGAAHARAQLPVCSDELPDSDVSARLARLSGAMRQEEPAVRRWWSTFLFLHGTMAVGAAIFAGSADDNEAFRNEMLVGMTSSTLAFVSLAILPPPIMAAGDSLRALPEDTPDQRLHKLRVAEGIFRRNAEAVDFLRSWIPATLSTLYVVGAATTLLLAFQRPSGAMSHSIGGVVLGLGRILLRPTSGRDAWRRYLRAHADAECSEAPPREVAPSAAIVPYGLGLGLSISF